MTSATPIAHTSPPARTRAVEPTPNHSQAGLSRVNQWFGHVHVGHAERPADHGGGALEYRQPARHVGREPHPEQPVLPDRAVYMGAELDPADAVPQQRLLGDPKPAEGELGD
jgi:hypothetical protein